MAVQAHAAAPAASPAQQGQAQQHGRSSPPPASPQPARPNVPAARRAMFSCRRCMRNCATACSWRRCCCWYMDSLPCSTIRSSRQSFKNSWRCGGSGVVRVGHNQRGGGGWRDAGGRVGGMAFTQLSAAPSLHPHPQLPPCAPAPAPSPHQVLLQQRRHPQAQPLIVERRGGGGRRDLGGQRGRHGAIAQADRDLDKHVAPGQPLGTDLLYRQRACGPVVGCVGGVRQAPATARRRPTALPRRRPSSGSGSAAGAHPRDTPPQTAPPGGWP